MLIETRNIPNQEMEITPAISTHQNGLPCEASAKQGRFISRIFTDQSGASFRLTFFVAVVNGELKGRLVSAQPLEKRYEIGGKSYENSSQVFYLPVSAPKIIPLTSYLISPALLVSPYVELYFFNSQPTRAPSFR